MHSLFKKRRSVRSFQDKEIEDEKLTEIVKAASVAPSGRNMKPWEFIVVEDQKVLKDLAEGLTWGSFLAGSAACVVVMGDEERSDLWLEDCSLASGHIYLEATNQGIGCCWVHVRNKNLESGKSAEKFVLDKCQVDGKFRVLCVLALGYPESELIENHDRQYDKSKVGWI